MEEISRGMSTYAGFTLNLGRELMLGREIAVPDRLFGLNDILPKLKVPDYLEHILMIRLDPS